MTTATRSPRCPDGRSHWWIIASPAGETSPGVCRLCQETRDFANSVETIWLSSGPKDTSFGRRREERGKLAREAWNKLNAEGGD